MGMSSSQARLLSLTARMHDIEYRAQRLEAQKLQLANESDKAYSDYLVALDAKKVQLKTIDKNGSITPIDATYQNLIDNGYTVTFKGFGFGLDHDVYENFVTATHNKTQFTDGNREYFAALQTNKTTPVATSGSLLAQGDDGYYEVYTSKQLAEILNESHNGIKVRLMSDVSMSGVSYEMHNLNGSVFDGNGHTISGLTKSLFNYIQSGSTVSNLNISGNIVTDAANDNGLGLFANKVKSSTIKNVSATGSVRASDSSDVGGFISSISDSIIQNCSANVNVTGESFVGGFVGYVDNSSIENCSSSGDVYANMRAGGFAGTLSNVSVKNSSSSCNITVDSTMFPAEWGYNESGNWVLISGHHPDSGGFVSFFNGGVIENCVARGSLTDLSGVSEDLSDDRNKPSIIAGFMAIGYGTIKNSDSYVDVTSTHTTHVSGFTSNYNNNPLTVEHCNYYGTTSINYNHPSNSSFATGVNSAIDIKDCYTADNNFDFAKGDVSNQTTNASSPYTNLINVASPTIATTVQLGADADYWRAIYDNVMKVGADEVYDLSNQDPYGLNSHKNDSTWLTNLLTEGYCYLHKVDTNGDVYDTSVSTETMLIEVQDEVGLRKAEAKYEADMRQIDMKDRRYDTELAAVDAERNAIKQEMDTLKTVIKDNVEMNFKLFS